MERRIAENEPGDLTIFSTEHKWTFRAANPPASRAIPPFDGRSHNFAALPWPPSLPDASPTDESANY
jgi:hypothetical protein